MKPVASENQFFCDPRPRRTPLKLASLAVMTVLLTILGASRLLAADPDIMGFLEDADEKLSKLREPEKLLERMRSLQNKQLELDAQVNAIEHLMVDDLAVAPNEPEREVLWEIAKAALRNLEEKLLSLGDEEEATWRDYKRIVESREKDLKTNPFKSGSTTNKPDTSSKPKRCSYCKRIGCPGPLSHVSGEPGVLGVLKEAKPR